MRTLALALIVASATPVGAATRMPPEYRARYEAVATCLGADVPKPAIEFDKTVACPTSGAKRCMKHYPFFQCGDVWCGASGAYYPASNTIWLADQYTAPMGHEAVHQILHQLGDPGWRDHDHPAFARCS